MAKRIIHADLKLVGGPDDDEFIARVSSSFRQWVEGVGAKVTVESYSTLDLDSTQPIRRVELEGVLVEEG